ncbi:nuclear transport factor 2 family protein [Erythrobacter sp. EC-HK427]|uniref:nuclear transport factor 2 family protein n=1 Tax=Erythrobacter sp. EC-HK427 TaxID=2038396 RepID=UPI001251BD7C|nr:nuclear transport factor 2 family protein [Erythrobacter sp. EC-HK427]VVT09785.1 conserved exported hypothetical protein [Erythrobacter sp. EC-HK427]
MLRMILAGAALAFAIPAAAQETPDYTQVSVETAPVTDAYIAAYTRRDWDALEPLLADDARFSDTTATRLFGPVLSEGREAIMQRFRVSYASITHMEFTHGTRIVSGENGIYEGVLHWGLDLGNGTIVDSVTPMVVLLTVADGKVTEHRDYVDYAPLLAAIEAARGE